MITIKSSKKDTIASLEDALAIREKQYRKLKVAFDELIKGRWDYRDWQHKAGLI